jgi:hypothetical protein
MWRQYKYHNSKIEDGDATEKLAVLEAAKLLFNYIEDNGLQYPCLLDDLGDFIGDAGGGDK